MNTLYPPPRLTIRINHVYDASQSLRLTLHIVNGEEVALGLDPCLTGVNATHCIPLWDGDYNMYFI